MFMDLVPLRLSSQSHLRILFGHIPYPNPIKRSKPIPIPKSKRKWRGWKPQKELIIKIVEEDVIDSDYDLDCQFQMDY